MFIAKFTCPNCRTNNKLEILFKKKTTIVSCSNSKCKVQVMTFERSPGCFVVLSSKNKNGLVMIIYAQEDYETATRDLNRQIKGKKVRFKVEAIFRCNSSENEQQKIQKNRKLNKAKVLAKGTYYKLPPAGAILILSDILRREPVLVFNKEYKIPTLPGF